MGLFDGGFLVMGEVVVVGDANVGGDVCCMLFSFENRRFTLLVRFCSSVTLLVGWISCRG